MFTRSSHSPRGKLLGLGAAAALALSLSSAFSALPTVYWRSAPGSGAWSTSTNWASTLGGTSGGSVPNSTTAIAVFDASSGTSITVAAGINLDRMILNAGAPTYTFTATGGTTNGITFNNLGIVNNSSNAPIFNIVNGMLDFESGSAANAKINLSSGSYLYMKSGTNGNSSLGTATVTSNSGIMYLENGATAANSSITLNGSTSFYVQDTATLANSQIQINIGSRMTLSGSATAGNATLTNTDINAYIDFYGNSSAGNAVINSYNGGFTYFYENATAGNSTLTVGTYTLFENNSTAGSAHLIVKAGSTLEFVDASSAGSSLIDANSGIVQFLNDSNGGNATINAINGGAVDISGVNSSTLGVGAISGNAGFYIGNRTLVIGSNNASTTFSGGIYDGGYGTGTDTGGSVVKIGTGTLTLSGSGLYTGTTTVQQGTLRIDSDHAIAGSALNYDNQGGTLVFSASTTNTAFGGLMGNQDLILTNEGGAAVALTVGQNTADNYTYGGDLSGLGQLIKAGTDAFVFTGTSTNAGGVKVTRGTFMLSGGGFVQGPLEIAGGTFDLLGGTYTGTNLLIDGGLVQDGSLTVGNFVAQSGTIAAALSGSNFVKTGPGTLTLSGTNTYTGPTTIQGGALRISGSAALPAGSYFALDGGVIEIGPTDSANFTSGTGTGQISWVGDGGFSVYSGSRTITFSGTGGLTWGQGGFVSDGHALILGSSTSDSTTIFGNGIDFGGVTRTVQVGNGSAAVDATLAGNLTNGGLNKTGLGTLTLTGTNTYAGGTTITGGLIQFNSIANFGSGPITLDGGGLRWATGVTTDVSAQLSYGNGGSIFDTNGNNVALATAIGGGTSGGLTKIGSGTLALTGNNTYTGTTMVSSGALVLSGSNNAIGDIVTGSGAILRGTTNASALGSGKIYLQGNSTLQLASDTSLAFGRDIVTTGTVVTLSLDRLTSGTGVTYTMGNAVFGSASDQNGSSVNITRTTRVSSGTAGLVLGNVVVNSPYFTFSQTAGTQLTLGTLAFSGTTYFTQVGATAAHLAIGNITGTNNGLLELGLNGQMNLTGTIAGAMSLKLDGSGTTTLSAANTFSGSSDLYAGATIADNNQAFGTGIIMLDGGTLRGNGTALTIANTLSILFASTIAGSSDLTFTGTLTNNSGNSVAFTINNTGTTTFGAVNLASAATSRTITLSIGSGANVLINGPIANGGTSTSSSLSKSGAGSLVLTGSSSYSGTTTLTAGTLTVGHDKALGTSTLALNGGGLQGGGGARTLANNVSLAASSAITGTSDLTITGTVALGNTTRTLTITNTGSTTLSGILSGTAGLTKAGPSLLALTGTASTYLGKTTISSGTLAVTSLANLSAVSSLGAPTTAANGTIDIGATGTAATLEYIGAGSTSNRIINQAGTTAGATIDASGSGALVLTGSITAAATAKTLTLTGNNTGTNTISGPIVNGTSSAVVSLLKTGAGSWTLSGANTYTGTTSIAGGMLNASNIVTSATSNLGNASSAVILGDAVNSGTLGYTGNTATYTRGFTVSAGGGGLNVTTAAQTLTVGTGGVATAGLFSVGGGGNTTISSVISGTGSLAKNGGGKLALSGSNSFSGGTIINSGTLAAQNNNAMGSGVVTVNGGVFLVDTGVTVANTVNLAGGSLARVIGAGSSLAGAVNSTSNLNGINTSATILAGTTTGTTTLQTSFAASSGALNDSVRLTDVYAFQGTGTDVFVMQLSFTDTKPNSYLGWINGGNQWVNAVTGNTGNNATLAQQGFAGNFAAFQTLYGTDLSLYIGAYGTDTTGGVTSTWAVLDHNSNFAAIPEPSTWVLLALGLASLVVLRQRRRGTRQTALTPGSARLQSR